MLYASLIILGKQINLYLLKHFPHFLQRRLTRVIGRSQLMRRHLQTSGLGIQLGNPHAQRKIRPELECDRGSRKVDDLLLKFPVSSESSSSQFGFLCPVVGAKVEGYAKLEEG